MYTPTHWLDHVKDADTGEFIQEGTEKSAGNFNKMEHGINDAHVAAAITMIAVSHTTAAQQEV